ncbi:MAG: efflux RND transporter periplasmic adaptor subunit [Candidatus Omnitrophica bacterium]|nr:efflux RND transporter periplasmic adaptor subunit [Candidatus Omnitrophota bacterium]
MKKVIMSIVILVFALLTIEFRLSTSYAQHEGHTKQASPKALYYCPMHPTYTSDRAGDCPICNMRLVKKEENRAEETRIQEFGDEGFYISPQKQQLIGVKTDRVIFRPLRKIISTVGRVAFDPQLYKAQQEYIEALKTQESLKESGQEAVMQRAEALVEAAGLKLKLQGLDSKQIDELAQKRENDQSLLISSAESDSAWVYATIYEYEFEWIKIGQEARITTSAYPAKEFKGTIVAIDPVFDAMTRSVRARIKVDNQDSLLKPDMYVDVQLSSDLGASLAVSKEAIMDSGVRKIVFLSQGEGYIRPVEIKTGVSTDEYVQVADGLKEGDLVVISGNFLIDSESKLKSALEGTSYKPGGDGLVSESQSHQHGQ